MNINNINNLRDVKNDILKCFAHAVAQATDATEMSEANFLLKVQTVIPINKPYRKWKNKYKFKSTYFPIVSALGGIRNIFIWGSKYPLYLKYGHINEKIYLF